MIRAAAVLFILAYTNAEYGPVHVCRDGDRFIADIEDLCRYHVCFQQNQGSVAMRCPRGTHVPLSFIDSDGGSADSITPCSEFHYATSCLRCEFEAADSCFNANCGPDCTCLDLGSEHRCICEYPSEDMNQEGFNSDPCESDPCQNGAQCVSEVGDYWCDCPNGFTGKYCEVSFCESNPCMNGGTCTVDDINYHCHCHEGYVGPCCSEDVITGILDKAPNSQVKLFSEEACTNYEEMKDDFQGQLVFICGRERRGYCMPLYWLCDGYYGCPGLANDPSDEEDCEAFCTAAIASGIRFTCPSSNYNPSIEALFGFPLTPDEPTCYHSDYFCDGFVDCGSDDDSDEKPPHCSPFDRVVEKIDGTQGICNSINSFQCNDKSYCTANTCNGFPDCFDGSDELNC